MAGTLTIAKKELLDIFTEKKFLLIFGTLFVMVIVSAIQGSNRFDASQGTAIVVNTGANSTSGNGPIPILRGEQNLAYALGGMIEQFQLVGALLAVAVSFDAVNRERQSGSLKTMLSYPIFRDSVVWGKYIGRLVAIALVTSTTILVGIGLFVSLTGTPLSSDYLGRFLIFYGTSIVFLALYVGIGLLLSILLPDPSTSLLVAVIIWLVEAALVPYIGWVVASVVHPPRPISTGEITLIGTPQEAITLRKLISGISPSNSYKTAVDSILTTSKLALPARPPNYTYTTISLGQAALSCLPSVAYLIALLITVFALCYVKFTRQEIR